MYKLVSLVCHVGKEGVPEDVQDININRLQVDRHKGKVDCLGDGPQDRVSNVRRHKHLGFFYFI